MPDRPGRQRQHARGRKQVDGPGEIGTGQVTDDDERHSGDADDEAEDSSRSDAFAEDPARGQRDHQRLQSSDQGGDARRDAHADAGDGGTEVEELTEEAEDCVDTQRVPRRGESSPSAPRDEEHDCHQVPPGQQRVGRSFGGAEFCSDEARTPQNHQSCTGENIDA